jgi:regulator of nucleoside diphosphate kinase
MFTSEIRSVLICETDRKRLENVVQATSGNSGPLFEELDAATIVPDSALPTDVVRMNALVIAEDVVTHQTLQMYLVYPDEVKGHTDRVSVTAPVGAALIGLRVGEEIEWPLPYNKTRRLKVLAVGDVNDEFN